MIYTVPTKKGLGLEIWGTDDDLTFLYNTIGKFWGNENFSSHRGYEDKNNVISGFAHELRKASYGSRLKRDNSHFSPAEIPYLGFKISWPHILFCMSALKYNQYWVETTKYDVSILLQLEFWIEKSINDYDKSGAVNLLKYLDGAISANNEYMYQFMRSIDSQFFEMRGGKVAFRKLHQLMRVSSMVTTEYQELFSLLQFEAKKYNCKIENLEVNENDAIYDIEW